MCELSVDRYASYMLCICYNYVNCMIIVVVQCVQGYVWDRIREGCIKRNVTIEVKYVHETLRLGYIPKWYG